MGNSFLGRFGKQSYLDLLLVAGLVRDRLEGGQQYGNTADTPENGDTLADKGKGRLIGGYPDGAEERASQDRKALALHKSEQDTGVEFHLRLLSVPSQAVFAWTHCMCSIRSAIWVRALVAVAFWETIVWMQ